MSCLQLAIVCLLVLLCLSNVYVSSSCSIDISYRSIWLLFRKCNNTVIINSFTIPLSESPNIEQSSTIPSSIPITSFPFNSTPDNSISVIPSYKPTINIFSNSTIDKQVNNTVATPAPSPLINDVNFINLLIKDADFNYPTVADCIAIIEKDRLMVYVIINYGNIPKNTRYKIHNSYSLIYNGKRYENILDKRNIYYIVQVVGYSIDQTHFNDSLIHFTVIDTKFNITTPVTTRILHSPPQKKHLGVCSYASSYNSLAEVISWVAYYKMVGADGVMLYYAENISHIISGLQNEVNSGFVRFFNFSWPLNKYHGRIQYAVQSAHINSCFYRNRHEFDYLVILDVDEYLLSEGYPFDLYKAIRRVDNRAFTSLTFFSNFYLAANKTVSREDSLRNGDIFKDFRCYSMFQPNGRLKQVMKSHAKPLLSIHKSTRIKTKRVNRKSIHVFHLKSSIPGKGKIICNYNTMKYYKKHNEMVKTIRNSSLSYAY